MARIEGDRFFSLLFVVLAFYFAYETVLDFADGTIDDPKKPLYTFLCGFIAGFLWSKPKD